ncbi:ubiquinone biosynthesis accessory factor UbiJ [Francisella salina]|uniref:Protein YigP n=1 Tax=Francisella salina TaxID=573569 RepID=A0ABM5M848_FRAST|nr:SCP2 sterol-binding domain-containing protein [Francisella salina]AEI35398.1 Protein YigP [Francisella salina]
MIQIIDNFLILLSKLDPQMSGLLLPLNNKTLRVEITDIDFSVTLKVEKSKIHATDEHSKNVLKGKLAHILELVFNKNLQELIIANKLDYQGSLKDLNEFNKFISAIDIDLVYKISEVTSPEFAATIAKPFTKAKQYLRTSRQETIVDIKDFLTEEKRTLISQNEINIFYRQVQELKQATDRIEAKLNLLQSLYND